MITLSIVMIVIIMRIIVKKNKKTTVMVTTSSTPRKANREIGTGVPGKVAVHDEPVGTPHKTEIERKKQFEIEQAEFDASFFERRLDALFAEYWEIKDQIAEAEENVKGYEQARHYERASKERKEIAKLQKKLSSLDSTIHNTEKKLRAAQYKAGKQVLC